MALIIPPGYAHVLVPFQHAQLARAAVITWGIDVDAAGGDYVQVANDMVEAAMAPWFQHIDNQVTVGPATLRVGQDGGDPLSVEGSYSEAGDESAAMSPPNTALLVKKQTGTGGRRGRGRLYMPWTVQEGATNDVGIIDPTSLAARQTSADVMLAELATPVVGQYSTPMVLLHDSSGAGTEPAPSVVTALVCDALIANQRRRLGR
jgi:hypothetical protein